jgi:hypothetical protein
VRTILSIAVLVLALSTARAAPPFAVYVIPNLAPDVYPVSQAARNAELAGWRGFLANDRAFYGPQAQISRIRLTDLTRSDGTPYGGWRFYVVVPSAPSPWKAPGLHVAIGGISLDARPRDVRYGSLVLDLEIDRDQLAAGTYKLEGTQGTKSVFALELVLEDGAADDPDPIARSRALDAAAAKRAPFVVAALPTPPACTDYPRPAGCMRGATTMWRHLFEGTLAGHPHVTRLVQASKPRAGAPLVYWPAYVVFPTGPAGWTSTDPEVFLDGKPVAAPHLRLPETEALFLELKLIDGAWAIGKHQLRVVDKQGNVLVTTEIELAR